MTQHDPFATLEIAPTCDVAAIKRGYFTALAKCPPHQDPEGFRRVRDAYETLSDPQACALAMLRAPLDSASELARFDATWGGRIAAAADTAHSQQRSERAVESFIERVSRMTWAETVASKPG